MLKSAFKKTAVALAVVTALAASTGQAADKPKVGFIYIGPTGDHGWTYQHEQGRIGLEKALGVETTGIENVAEGPDAERVANKLIAQGHDMIFATSFAYMNPIQKSAKRNPKVYFEHATGYKQAKNVSTYLTRTYEGRYAMGHLAGKMTKTNVIGYIASFPIPEVIRDINAVILGAQKVNPDTKIKVIWVSSWFDPGKESDAAKTLIDQGADIILQHTDSPAPLQVAEERGVWAVGQASDMSKFAPKAHLVSVVNNWTPYYIERTKAVMDGTWKSHNFWGGFKDDMLQLAKYNKAIPSDIVKSTENIRIGIAKGKIHPFTGPIKDQSGKVVIPAGKTASDKDLATMNYYVQGVDGVLPK